MLIAITGGTGFIGGHLADFWRAAGHRVVIVSRHPGRAQESDVLTWAQLHEQPELLDGVEAIVNLAGSSINKRWTAEAKRVILESRLDAARRVAELVERLAVKPRVVLNASGMSIYGTSETQSFDETSPPRITDFLASVVEEWERAADRIPVDRLVKIRVGLVLDGREGAFPKMALPYKLGVGGRVGSGRQWLSWIHIADMVRLIDFCLQHDDMAGAVNATAPHPVTNAAFGAALAKAMRRPNLFPVPAWVMRLAFGELAILLLEGQRVLPRALLEHGFEFRYPQLEAALADIVGGGAAR
ncbi:TIGR01777 family protein [Paenibacillus athensensis]|uniref:TIGR01777 family protein n=1 Tax=Paenibacillus athensensis TaxID=1967502 RepID=A0A4Y8Q9D4_9BACL|nr:TIGR01777 family oxidoreductase [Paenibacillus athensensis]MCD1259018.1 TIGR01777 family protein [Paenibacillus athensensis]